MSISQCQQQLDRNKASVVERFFNLPKSHDALAYEVQVLLISEQNICQKLSRNG